MDHEPLDAEARFAGYVATLGRGPGRSRALTREEARDALALVLADAVHPAQVGAFLMLLRYRGEDPDEITGLVEAVRQSMGLPIGPDGGESDDGLDGPVGPVDLDWPSYGAGRTRGAPWFLLAALALARAGHRVLMHGSNEFSGGMTVGDGLAALGLSPCPDAAAVREALDRTGFAYWPVARMAPAVDRLLGMRRLFGLRSPINTVARLIDPGCAGASVDGVFHPPYIALHLGVVERLGRRSLAVIKGGGGEAERPPAKITAAHLWRRDGGRSECLLPALAAGVAVRQDGTNIPDGFARLWYDRGGDEADPVATATVIGTIALALIALDPSRDPDDADRHAREIWTGKRGGSGDAGHPRA